MKKVFLVVLFSIILASCFALPSKETKSISIAVMQGPTGFSSAMLGDGFDISVYPSPNEAVARILKGELDMAVLPANVAATLYNVGVDIKAVAVTGEGMLSLIGTDESSSSLNVPGAGGTPDHMARLLYPSYEPDYSVSAPAQLAQLLIAGKTELAILPQPFVTMVLGANSSVKVISDVQQMWEEKTGADNYPMSILVASGNFVRENPQAIKKAAEAYSQSVSLVNGNPHEAATRIEELGIMAGATAESAIPHCALVYLDGKDAMKLCNSYFETLLELDPEAIGNKVPDSGFWVQ
jgi:NitT/TauT family transport system substrate-binding protein